MLIVICRPFLVIRKDYETKNYAVYVILGYDVDEQLSS